ncbi:MAG: endonuclease/exonuclease/phosphatase family protein, partial [Myxococcota bacterium]
TERLERELPGYRLVQRSREDAFGIALLSRLPMSHGQVIYPAGGQLPAIEAVIEAHGQRVAVLAIHPPPPVTAELSAERDRVIAAAADWSRAPASGAGAVDHAVVVGDMNATPWSWPMRRLVRDSELIDSLRGHGVQTSWPSQLIPLSIPIDHVLHSPSLTAVERSVGPFMGSDHRPVHVALAPVAN